MKTKKQFHKTTSIVTLVLVAVSQMIVFPTLSFAEFTSQPGATSEIRTISAKDVQPSSKVTVPQSLNTALSGQTTLRPATSTPDPERKYPMIDQIQFGTNGRVIITNEDISCGTACIKTKTVALVQVESAQNNIGKAFYLNDEKTGTISKVYVAATNVLLITTNLDKNYATTANTQYIRQEKVDESMTKLEFHKDGTFKSPTETYFYYKNSDGTTTITSSQTDSSGNKTETKSFLSRENRLLLIWVTETNKDGKLIRSTQTDFSKASGLETGALSGEVTIREYDSVNTLLKTTKLTDFGAPDPKLQNRQVYTMTVLSRVGDVLEKMRISYKSEPVTVKENLLKGTITYLEKKSPSQIRRTTYLSGVLLEDVTVEKISLTQFKITDNKSGEVTTYTQVSPTVIEMSTGGKKWVFETFGAGFSSIKDLSTGVRYGYTQLSTNSWDLKIYDANRTLIQWQKIEQVDAKTVRITTFDVVTGKVSSVTTTSGDARGDNPTIAPTFESMTTLEERKGQSVPVYNLDYFVKNYETVASYDIFLKTSYRNPADPSSVKVNTTDGRTVAFRTTGGYDIDWRANSPAFGTISIMETGTLRKVTNPTTGQPQYKMLANSVVKHYQTNGVWRPLEYTGYQYGVYGQVVSQDNRRYMPDSSEVRLTLSSLTPATYMVEIFNSLGQKTTTYTFTGWPLQTRDSAGVLTKVQFYQRDASGIGRWVTFDLSGTTPKVF